MPDVQKLAREFLAAHGVKTHIDSKSEELADIAKAYAKPGADDAAITAIIKEQFEKRPHMADGAEQIETRQADLERAAFGEGNITKQGELVRLIGMEQATARATAWGTKIGSTAAGASPFNGANKDGATNPFSENFKGSDEYRNKRIGEMIKFMGTAKVAAIAKAAGMDIAGRPLRK